MGTMLTCINWLSSPLSLIDILLYPKCILISNEWIIHWRCPMANSICEAMKPLSTQWFPWEMVERHCLSKTSRLSPSYITTHRNTHIFCHRCNTIKSVYISNSFRTSPSPESSWSFWFTWSQYLLTWTRELSPSSQKGQLQSCNLKNMQTYARTWPWDLKRVYLFGRYLHQKNALDFFIPVQVVVESNTFFDNSSN